MELHPIGVVRSVQGNVSEIEVRPELLEGLLRIDENEKLLILFLFDRSGETRLQVHPRVDPRNPLVGVFASRSPDRPNHIGATIVHLVKVDGNVLTVEGLDAWEGSPVLDIKPDARRDAVDLGRSEGKD